jgi:hypothetical protein
MAMQVSWIDADQIKALVAQIAPEQPDGEAVCNLMEIDTVPDGLLAAGAAPWGFAMDWQDPPVKTVAAPAAGEAANPVAAEPVLLNPQLEMEEESDPPHEDEPSSQMAPAALPLSRIRDKLRAIRQRATEAGILTRTSEVVAVEAAPETAREVITPPAEPIAAVAPPQTPVFEIPAGTREVRLAAFAGWARQVLQEDGGHVLVMSDDGEVLWGGEAKAGLVLSTMMAWGAAIRASAMSACGTPPLIHQPLASGNVLTVIPCETVAGMVHAAVAAPVGLTREQAHLLRGALCAAMN